MADNTTIEVEMSKGYAGKIRAYEKGYVARITGTDSTYGYARTFYKGKADSNEPFRKTKCQWNDVYTVGEGLYEISEGGSRRTVIVVARDGALVRSRVDSDRAISIAKRLDEGQTFAEAVAATKPAPAPAN